MADLKPAIRAIGDQVVVRPVYPARPEAQGMDLNLRMSEGGVALPDTVANEPIEGIVESLGDGYVEGRCETCEPHGRQHQFSVKVNDTIVFPLYKATSIILADGEHCLISERDISGIRP